MFKGLLFGFLVSAAAYVILMRVMARRADVLHGEYIQPDRRPAPRHPGSTFCSATSMAFDCPHEASRRPLMEGFLRCRVDWRGGYKLGI
jgi:hypothetical protein